MLREAHPLASFSFCEVIMNINFSKLIFVFFLCCFVLIACSSAQTDPVIIPTETISDPPVPTTLPYWDLLPLDFDPEGGWTTVLLNESDISIQLPSVYQEGACGKLFTEDKDVANYKARLIGFEGGTIRIHIYSEWEADLDKLVRDGEAPPRTTLVSPVERFSLGGIPAVRLISTNPDQKMLLYSKGAWAYYHDKLYSFSYGSAPYLPSCDAFPLSEEQVFEYLLSTVEFLE
jgi:hypothetical protein